jgi:hypothetical protein
MLAMSAVTFWRWLTGQSFPTQEPSAAAPAEERRVWLRHTANLNIHCKQVSDDPESGVYGLIRTISRGGMQLIAPQRFEPGSILSVESASSEREKDFAVLAFVVRAQPHGDSEWSMGCRFSSELGDEQLQAFGAARARPQTPDPRAWSRFPCDTQAVYQCVNSDDQAHYPARVVNISVGGVALQVDEPIALGELLSTELHDSTGRPVVTILACVVHVHTIPDGQILGCQFIRELGEDDLRLLLSSS